MPSASEILFKAAGLNRFGQYHDFVAPAPLPASEIRKLGDELDAAEKALEDCWRGDTRRFSFSPDCVPAEVFNRASRRLSAAKMAFGEALAVRSVYLREKFRQRSTPLREADLVRLRDKMYAASDRVDMFEKLKSEFYTKRQWTTANHRLVVADANYESALILYRDQSRQHKAERRAGIVRRPYSRRSRTQ
jgi:hypothetical protein